MKPTTRPALIALALAAVGEVTPGCGAAASSGPGSASQAPPAGEPFLATSLVTPAGTWAIAVMGGSVSTHNNFWQMFARPAGSTAWKLVTPPGVADNGGLVAASASAGPLITGIRPSQDLTYTPLALTRNGGQAWSPTGPLDAALAAVPDALAAAPGTGRLLALLTNGTVKAAAPGYTRWTTLTSRALAGYDTRRPALRPDHPHRGCVHPLGNAATGRAVRPPRHRWHLRRQQRHLAGRRPLHSRPHWVISTPPCSG